MGDDVLRQAGKYPAAAGAIARRLASEVTEQQRRLLGTVIGIGLAHGVRIDAQAPDIFAVAAARRRRGIARRRSRVDRRRLAVGLAHPEHHPPQRALEVAHRFHGDGKHHLLVELRVAIGRRQSVLRQQHRIVEIDRRIKAAAGRIEIDDFDIFVNRTFRKRVFPTRFPWQLDNGVVDQRCIDFKRSLGIEGEHPQRPLRRRRWGRCRFGPKVARA